MCFKQEQFRLGANDVLLGKIAGYPF
jgi:uncharacterized protein (DUF779 family)